ncbi:hypothetical protein ES708_31031 [subsurface metagenome]
MSLEQTYPQIETPAQGKLMDTYSISTPFGTVTISQGGRKITFDLYADVRQSRHNTALFNYIQRLRKKGITQLNTDHLNMPGTDRRLSLTRGKSKLDLVYIDKGKTYECELKTSRELGLDVTARQLTELTKWCDNLILLVPKGCLEEAATILNMINLDHLVTIQPYDTVENER